MQKKTIDHTTLAAPAARVHGSGTAQILTLGDAFVRTGSVAANRSLNLPSPSPRATRTASHRRWLRRICIAMALRLRRQLARSVLWQHIC
jgi:hypothetical protein